MGNSNKEMKQQLLDNGWYRAAHGWWHVDLGREPLYKGGKTLHEAVRIMESWVE
jgi:hypothetical protein